MTGSTTGPTLGGYRLEIVHGRLTPEHADAITRLWLEAGALTHDEARRRLAEVVCVALAPNGEVAGVNTVYVADFLQAGQPYYFYRTFIRPADRGVFGLPQALFRAARDHLHRHAAGPGAPLGLVVVIENPKLMRTAARQTLRELGLTHLGKGPRGKDLWCLRFDGGPPPRIPGQPVLH